MSGAASSRSTATAHAAKAAMADTVAWYRVTEDDRGEATGHGEGEERAEKIRLLTLNAWVCSVTTGRAGDGGNRR